MALAGDVERVVVRAAQGPGAQLEARRADRAAQRPERRGQSAGRAGSFISMLLSDYQSRSRATAVYPQSGDNILYPTLGLCGEAGEVAEKIKKMVRDDGGILSDERRAALSKELGDVLWYVAQIATEADLDLDTIAEREPREAPQPAGPQRAVRQRRRPLTRGTAGRTPRTGARSEAPRGAGRSFGGPPNPLRSAMHPSIRHYAIRVDRENAIERAESRSVRLAARRRSSDDPSFGARIRAAFA